MPDEQLDKLRQELRRGVLVLAVLGSLKQPHYGYSLRKQLQRQILMKAHFTRWYAGWPTRADSEWHQGDGRERRYYVTYYFYKKFLPGTYSQRKTYNAVIHI